MFWGSFIENTGLDFKACGWLRYFLPIFPKIAVRQTVEGRGAAEGNSKQCKPFCPTQYMYINKGENNPIVSFHYVSGSGAAHKSAARGPPGPAVSPL